VSLVYPHRLIVELFSVFAFENGHTRFWPFRARPGSLQHLQQIGGQTPSLVGPLYVELASQLFFFVICFLGTWEERNISTGAG